MLKRYCVNGSWFWFEEGEQPEGAVEERIPEPEPEPEKKERRTANKSRAPRTKKV